MKKILAYTVITTALLGLAACQSEEEDLFDSSAANRLEQSRKIYTERLSAAENGGSTWVMEYYPTNYDYAPQGIGYIVLAKFNPDGSVYMAMQNAASRNSFVGDSSLWEVIYDQGPVLTFNSYNKAFHTFSDPGLSGGDLEQGEGYGGDYEFEVLSLPENAEFAMLKGKKRGTYIRMSRLPNDTDFEEYLADINSFSSRIFNSGAPNIDKLTAGETEFTIKPGSSSGYISMFPTEGDSVTETVDYPFLLVKYDDNYHLRFRDEMNLKGYETPFQELNYNADQDVFYTEGNDVKLEGGDPVTYFTGRFSSKSFQLNSSTSSSGLFKDGYTEVLNDMKAKSASLTQMTFSTLNADSVQLAIAFSRRTGGRTQNQTVRYVFSQLVQNNKLTLNYLSPVGNGDQTVFGQFPSIAEFFAKLSQTFIISEDITRFNLSTLKLMSESDPDSWLVVKF